MRSVGGSRTVNGREFSRACGSAFSSCVTMHGFSIATWSYICEKKSEIERTPEASFQTCREKWMRKGAKGGTCCRRHFVLGEN